MIQTSKQIIIIILIFFLSLQIISCGDDPEAQKEKKSILSYNKAMILVEEGKYEEALTFFDNSIKLNPNDELAYFNRAVVKHNLARYKEAVIDYSAALNLPSGEGEGDNSLESAATYNYRALAKMKLEDYRGAIADFGEAIKLNPNLAEYYVNRAEALRILDYMDSACMDWSKAGELGNEHVYELIKKYCQ